MSEDDASDQRRAHPAVSRAVRTLVLRRLLIFAAPYLYYCAVWVAVIAMVLVVIVYIARQSVAGSGSGLGLSRDLDRAMACADGQPPASQDPPCIPGYLVEPLIDAGNGFGRYGCPEVDAPLLAAQIAVESTFDPEAVSPAGAKGLSQFMDDTWAEFGDDYDGDGDARPFDPEDSIVAQTRYMCHLADEVRPVYEECEKATNASFLDEVDAALNNDHLDQVALQIRCADVDGITSLMLAAYNAGPGRVKSFHGIPVFRETLAYVDKIPKWASLYAAATPVAANATEAAQRAIAWALDAVGGWYHFGGSCLSPLGGNPAMWCDCSSLMQQAWLAGGVGLPRTTYEQVDAANVVVVATLAELQPGDLVFAPGPDGDANGHVAMYIGAYADGANDWPHAIVVAPSTGKQIRVGSLDGYLGNYPAGTIHLRRPTVLRS
ncbi:transglycosylase SLT domain-containing protein [Solwaraspora sp. WMMB335]|uniref:transglycosylase SLT domain-containing protein n=1 Tax=Solwaraspora sp. WMMB335 TaxID=3404118 RepID=UPI003B92F03B